MLHCYDCGVFIEKYVYTKFSSWLVVAWASYMAIYAPIAWGCLLFFYKKYIVFQIVYMFLWSELEVAFTSPSFVTLHFLVSEIRS